MIIGGINIFAGILTTIQQFLKVSEYNEAHRVSAIAWDKFYRNIKIELAKHPSERIDVKQMVKMSKEERLRYYDSVPSHAMLITAYNKFEDEINPSRWKVENSWGATSGTNGFLLLTDSWFDEYVFQIVVHKDLLKEEELSEIGKVHKVIPPWDPLGTLA
jgi:aminopeptidase C